MVTIKLNLTLIKSVEKKELVLNIKDPRPLNDILEEIGLSQEEIGMVIINNRWAPLDCIIEENDEIQVFPHLEGG